jgi:hypothetical protein
LPIGFLNQWIQKENEKPDLVAAGAMAEKRPAVSGPEEAITDMKEDPKRPRHEELTEAEVQAQVRPPALPSKP